jgi:hypothetical protein
MFRFINKYNYDCQSILRGHILGLNSECPDISKLEIASLPIPIRGEEHTHNTFVKVSLPNPIRGKLDYTRFKYNRVDIGVLLRGVTLNRYYVNSHDDFIEYMSKSGIYLEYNFDVKTFFTDEGKFTHAIIKTKPNNYLFFGEVTIKAHAKKKLLSAIIRNNIILFGPNEHIWYDDELSHKDYTEFGGSRKEVYDLFLTTNQLFISHPNSTRFTEGRLRNITDSDRWIADNFNLLKEFTPGKRVSDYSKNYAKLLYEIFKYYHNIHAYTIDDTLTSVKKYRYTFININKCDILYNGPNTKEEAGEYFNAVMDFERGSDAVDSYHILILKPNNKFYSTYLFFKYIQLSYEILN